MFEDKVEPVIIQLINIYQRVKNLSFYLGDERTGEDSKAPIKSITWIFNLIKDINQKLDFIETEVKKLK